MTRPTHFNVRLTAPRQYAVAEVMRREEYHSPADAIDFVLAYLDAATRRGGGPVRDRDIEKLPAYVSTRWNTVNTAVMQELVEGTKLPGLQSITDAIDFALNFYLGTHRQGRTREGDLDIARKALAAERESFAKYTAQDRSERAATLHQFRKNKDRTGRLRKARTDRVKLYRAIELTPHTSDNPRRCRKCVLLSRAAKIEAALHPRRRTKVAAGDLPF